MPMRDWAISYILAVLEAKDWSANQLATNAGVAASTINRPLREKDWPHKLSRTTISKIRDVSGVDPTPFIPDSFAEDAAVFGNGGPNTLAARSLSTIDRPEAVPNAQTLNEIKIAVVGPLAQIVATVNREGLTKLRQKLDAIEAMLDE